MDETIFVLVCQGRSCRKQGSESVLRAFLHQPVVGVSVVGSSCMGQCGNGPMVRVVPEEVWYCRVMAEEVPAVVDRHLRNGQWIRAMLYTRFHSCDSTQLR
jgi:(2Fe-2S) ferredoxin